MPPQQLDLILETISLELQIVRNPEVSQLTPGQSHDVYRLEYPDGQRWILRIAKDDFAIRLSRRGRTILKHVKTNQPSLQVPALIYDAVDYTIFEYLDGSPVGSWIKNVLSGR
ncbi:hypothetical protein CERZMDRAFT_42568 [Cercospora zeae-maydis SCOH1-5]|uniref:Aminoglycoside phosphotransferase domain-containing protein n=1 Tax=Cercospora zeae-maydis SCOH1-5 TaxID=717836 RepID=A0A6A6FED6_9PEZI|nr:hypothetical protein CERZMDRAFT_42568 [Cercospora zeae-maydis SCOH1-5]